MLNGVSRLSNFSRIQIRLSYDEVIAYVCGADRNDWCCCPRYRQCMCRRDLSRLKNDVLPLPIYQRSVKTFGGPASPSEGGAIALRLHSRPRMTLDTERWRLN